MLFKKALSAILAVMLCILSLSVVFAENVDDQSGKYIVQASGDSEASLSTVTEKEKLKMTLDYCAGMTSDKYTATSWSSLLTALATAQNVYDTSTSETAFTSARTALEKVKAKMNFVDSTDSSNPLPFREISGSDTVYEMGVGWNLGNTMDGHTGFLPSETAWQSVITTKEIIKSVHDAGFNTVRIPVTWGEMIDDSNGYTINEAWISRVQDIVDYCTSLNMYAIINIHHDGAEQDGWLRVAADDIDSVYEKYECVWRNIATYFKDYDEHLIFEAANELTCIEGDNKNSAAAIAYDTPVIVNLNQIFVNVVRSTGSNNKKRWLAAVSHYANGGTQSGFSLPTDSYNSTNRLMFEAHIYKSSSNTTWTYDQVYQVVSSLKSMVTKQKVPVILGEYGNINKANSANPSSFNDIDRAWFDEIVTRACRVAGAVPCVWDQGYFDLSIASDSTFSVWDREGQKPIFKTITDAMMRGVYLTPSSKNAKYDMTDIVSNPTIQPIESITLSENNISLDLGTTKTVTATSIPATSNDVVLWKSSDDNIATVYRGNVKGKKPGTATITAYSQSGSAVAQMNVTVKTVISDNPVQSINTDKDSYSLIKGKYVNINAGIMPSDSADTLVYYSSNPNIATVNALGKIVAVNPGTTYVTVTASSGATKVVPVTVTESGTEKSIDLATNVYYSNSSITTNEVGGVIKVTGDGQYTLSFDVSKDLTDKAKNAGITNINNVVSIYIKDNAVTLGQAVKSNLDSCDIRYDEIKVNDTPLTITKGGFKSALKDSGVFDSNDPINGWDGSAVSEITKNSSTHTVTFNSITNPTKIEITFTLQNLKFKDDTPTDTKPATSIECNEKTINIYDINSSSDVIANLLAKDTDSNVTFVSSDNNIVVVDESAKTVDENGSVRAKATAISEGTAKITALTDNGLSCEYTVNVGMPFSDVTTVADGNKISGVNANWNYTPCDKISIIIGVYNSDGAIMDCEVHEYNTQDVLSEGKLSASGFNLEVNTENSETAKAFIWNNTNDDIPLSK